MLRTIQKKVEDKKMKRKIVAFLTIMFSVTLLGGCGGSLGKEETLLGGGSGSLGKEETPKSIVDGKEMAIAYVSKNYEKDSKPKKVIVFEDGIATLYDAGNYTMGDFSKMTDEEVVENLQSILEDEKNAKIEECKADLEDKQNDMKDLEAWSSGEGDDATWLEWMMLLHDEGTEDLLGAQYYNTEYLRGYVYENLTYGDIDVSEALYYLALNKEDEQFGQGKSLAEDWQDYILRHDGEDFLGIFDGYAEVNKMSLDDIRNATEHIDTTIAAGIEFSKEESAGQIQENKESLQESIDYYSQKLEELQNQEVTEKYPTKISLITDGTGNAVNLERIVMLGEDSIEYEISLKGVVYSEDSRKAVYESQYVVYGVTTDGSDIDGFMLVRDDSKNGAKFGMDTLKTKGVFIDAKAYSDFAE